jgi:hypothetical protein
VTLRSGHAESATAARLRARSHAWSDAQVTLALLGAIAVAAIGAFAWIYAGDLTYDEGAPIRADGLSYYVYLPALVLDHDLTLRRTARRSFFNTPQNIDGVQLVRTSSGQLLPFDPHGVGVAVLMAPFFGAGDVLARLTNEPRDGFSWPYQAAAAASGLVYLLLGLALTASFLRRFVSRRTVVLTVLALTFGTDLFHYGTYDATYSHVYSFFLVALVLRLTLALRDRPCALTAAALGAGLGLVGLVRLTNLVVVLFCLLLGVQRLGDLAARGRTLLRRLDLVAIGAVVLAALLVPQVAYWYHITGRFFVNQYSAVQPPGHLDLLDPHVFGVLFSVRKGLFFWTPLLLLAVAGLPLLRRYWRGLLVPAVVYLVVQVWVVASWSRWWYDGAFGMRALVDALPVFALGLAALIEAARGAAARRAVNAGLVVTTFLCLHGMVAYWLKALPYDSTTFSEYIGSFTDYGYHAWEINE